MKTKLFALLAVLLLLSGAQMPSVSAAGAMQLNRWEQQVVDQLVASPLLQSYVRVGYKFQADASSSGLLHANTRIDKGITFKAGYEHFLIGKCDADCSDLDLYLFNSNGVLVAQDIGLDDYPAISLRPNQTANYTVRVTMASCSSMAGCYWGVIVASR